MAGGQARDRLFVRAPVSRRVRSRRVARESAHDRPRRRRHPQRARSPRRPGGSRRRLLGRAHAARRRELPDHRPDASRTAPDLVERARRGQAGGGAAPTATSACSTPNGPRAIVAACEEIRGGALHDQFVVDVIQGGAGTSTNMNANEVIANRALEILGHAARRLPAPAPERPRQPEPEHQRRLSDGGEARRLVGHRAGCSRRWRCCAAPSRRKAVEFADVLKMGRTQLQDAVPMTLGQEFGTYALMLAEDEARLAEAARADPRDQPGRHRDRHRHHRPPGLRRRGSARTCAEITGIPLVTAPGPRRGDPGLRRLRAALGRAEAGRGQALQDLQRPAAALLGPARRLRRDQPAGAAGRLVDHARQGEPGDPGGGEPGRLRGDRQRRHHHHGGRGGPAPAQRLRAGDLLQPRPLDHPPDRRLPDAGGELRPRHHRQPRAAARDASRTRSASSPRSTRTSATPTPPRLRSRRTRAAGGWPSSSSRRG